MLHRINVVILALFKLYYCDEHQSFEIHDVQISPLNEAIIFSDIIDIFKDGNVHMNYQADADSESVENVEDLLSEYQHYLDKLNEQRRAFIINNTKNKVPLLPKVEGYRKKLPVYNTNNGPKHAPSYFKPNVIRIPSIQLNDPLDIFLPLNPDIIDVQQMARENIPERNYIIYGAQPTKSLPYTNVNKKMFNVTCFCNPERWPCKCTNSLLSNNALVKPGNLKQNSEQYMNLDLSDRNATKEITNKTLNFNVRIKVDIQLPSIPIGVNKYGKSAEEVNSKEYISNIKLPATYFDIPLTVDTFGFKKNKQIFDPIHKIMIHNKNKLRSSSNKKHRKKFSPFNKLEQPQNQQKNVTKEKQSNKTIEIEPTNLVTNLSNTTTKITNFSVASSEVYVNKPQVDESIVFMVNISNSENDTDKRLGNSIEVDNKFIKLTTTIPLKNIRSKREIALNDDSKNTNLNKSLHNKTKKYMKWKSNKSILSDNDLLYWPDNSSNETVKTIIHIDDLLSKSKNNRTEFNITSEMIHINRTVALQQAIFGDVNWNDIDTIVPTFLQFVGKYINGAMTICSEHVCHSMKCANSTCLHRTCAPEQLFDHTGHCLGSNKTDSLILVQPIIDLPSNAAFHIIDILEEKMLGKLFGKITLCVGTKCLGLATTKRTFIKFKCQARNLKTGHCPSAVSNKTA
ncbi:hypothetical protein ACJJTC_015328 [Scirpophaga incertulas]